MKTVRKWMMKKRLGRITVQRLRRTLIPPRFWKPSKTLASSLLLDDYDESKPITEVEGSNTDYHVEDMEQEEAEAAPLVNEETLKFVLEDSQVDMVEDKAAVEEVENEEALEKEDDEVLDKEDEEVLEKKDKQVLEKGEEEMDDTVEEGEDSLKLVLEPDTPLLEEEEVSRSSHAIIIHAFRVHHHPRCYWHHSCYFR